ncbi:uncharacterized protein EI90DRAFT_3121622 [Cantharellus anzutake]|uniref:uncharacterized protein n=1 Tax=Cantharellus anzutake TaxID=1750568 RepID=UPI00190877AA|nr:uncharacterized protein EI90DRAFT_3121622 [Cantharellus anzutake]KAF8334302.1 hypothetical protein EI90DRAFT_3121622 [Cantharellus anzutake]
MATLLISFILAQSVHAAPICQHPALNTASLPSSLASGRQTIPMCQAIFALVVQSGFSYTQMIFTLVAPEAAVATAWEDFSMACRLSRQCAEIQGWTLSHSYFVNMGGFFDGANGNAVEPDGNPSTLFKRYPGIIKHSGEVAVSKEEILDRSKGDFFAKLIVAIQLVWFAAQYVGRWAHRLPRSQLEAMTLAYASLSILVCALWWRKPLDVHFPIYVMEGSHSNPSNPDANTDQVQNMPNPTSPAGSPNPSNVHADADQGQNAATLASPAVNPNLTNSGASTDQISNTANSTGVPIPPNLMLISIKSRSWQIWLP